MTLIRLSLTDFRNHAGADMAAASGLVALHGDNGAGKTNILEAISFLRKLWNWKTASSDA
jgi:DNA replication and repair protein RecF